MRKPQHIPRNIYDLAYLRDTSCRSTNGVIHADRYDTKEIGGIIEEGLILQTTYDECISIRHYKLILNGYDDSGWLKCHQEITHTENFTFDEFTHTDYWDMTLDAWSDGEGDFSPLQDITVTKETSYARIDMNVMNYTDAGYKTKTHSKASVELTNEGVLEVVLNDKGFALDIRDVIQLVDNASMLTKAGIKIRDNKLTIPLED